MKRRDFLKYSGLLGLGGMLPMASPMNLFAAQDGYTGPLWLSIDARGGWDPTSFCDPKGYTATTAPTERINNYAAANIIQIANSPFSIAPMPEGAGVPDTGYTAQMFFEKYKQDLLVVNGLDYQTNGHADGIRHVWSGELGRQGYPNFAALIASELAGNKAMPFITNGGYSNAADLTTPIRISNSGLAALVEIAYPNRSQNASNVASRTYYSPEVANLIKESQQERFEQLLAAQKLSRIRAAMEKFRLAGQSSAGMTDFADYFSSGLNPPGKVLEDFQTATTGVEKGDGRKNAFRLYQQGRIALVAYKTGVTAAAHISMVGFDTHSSHDSRHHPRLMDYLMAVDAILDEASAMGLADSLVVTMGSDFGRTNSYNDGNKKNADGSIDETSRGKDHWPIGSMMFMGNSTQKIQGGRVIGATDDQFKALKIDPLTLEVDQGNSNVNSIRITPAHVHHSLRRLAGVGISDVNNAAATNFPLDGEFIDLFG